MIFTGKFELFLTFGFLRLFQIRPVDSTLVHPFSLRWNGTYLVDNAKKQKDLWKNQADRNARILRFFFCIFKNANHQKFCNCSSASCSICATQVWHKLKLTTGHLAHRMLSGMWYIARGHRGGSLFRLGLWMNFGMSLLLIWPSKFSTTSITCKWFFSCVCSYVSCKMIWSTKRPHTNSTLKRFLTCMYPNMPCKFITPWKPSVALINWTGIRPFMDRSLTRAVGVFACPHWHEAYGHTSLLVHLGQDFMSLACWLVKFC